MEPSLQLRLSWLDILVGAYGRFDCTFFIKKKWLVYSGTGVNSSILYELFYGVNIIMAQVSKTQ